MRVHFVGSVRSERCSRPSTIASSGFDAARRVGHLAGLLVLDALVQQQRGVTAVVEDHVRAVAVGPRHHLLGAPPVLLERLALPGVDRDALRVLGRAVRADDDGRRGVVLGGEDVAARPAHLGAELDERLDEHGGLDRHVQRAGDARAGERLGRRRTRRAAPAGRASRARRGGSPCARTGRATGRRRGSRDARRWRAWTSWWSPRQWVLEAGRGLLAPIGSARRGRMLCRATARARRSDRTSGRTSARCCSASMRPCRRSCSASSTVRASSMSITGMSSRISYDAAQARVVQHVLVGDVVQRALVLRAGEDLEQGGVEGHRFALLQVRRW